VDIESSITISLFIGMFAVAETISVIGNLYELNTGKRAPEFDGVNLITLGILRRLKLLVDRAFIILGIKLDDPTTGRPKKDK